MTEVAQSTNYWEELAHLFAVTAAHLTDTALAKGELADRPGYVEQGCERLLDNLPAGPGVEERVLALLLLAAAQVMQGKYEDAESTIAEAWADVDALEEAARREAE